MRYDIKYEHLIFVQEEITQSSAQNITDRKGKEESYSTRNPTDRCTVPKSRAAVDYTLTGVEPRGPTRSV